MSNSVAPDPQAVVKRDGPVYDEVLECIQLPKFDPRAMKARIDKSASVELPEEVVNELQMFIRSIASQYRQNPFHSSRPVSSGSACLATMAGAGI